jgi:hypothetical protein
MLMPMGSISRSFFGLMCFAGFEDLAVVLLISIDSRIVVAKS